MNGMQKPFLSPKDHIIHAKTLFIQDAGGLKKKAVVPKKMKM